MTRTRDLIQAALASASDTRCNLTKDQKLIILQLINERKHVLFARNTDQVTSDQRKAAWQDVIDECRQSFGFEAVNHPKGALHLRDHVWGDIKQRVIKRLREGKTASFGDLEYVVLEILGEQVPPPPIINQRQQQQQHRYEEEGNSATVSALNNSDQPTLTPSSARKLASTSASAPKSESATTNNPVVEESDHRIYENSAFEHEFINHQNQNRLHNDDHYHHNQHQQSSASIIGVVPILRAAMAANRRCRLHLPTKSAAAPGFSNNSLRQSLEPPPQKRFRHPHHHHNINNNPDDLLVESGNSSDQSDDPAITTNNHCGEQRGEENAAEYDNDNLQEQEDDREIKRLKKELLQEKVRHFHLLNEKLQLEIDAMRRQSSSS